MQISDDSYQDQKHNGEYDDSFFPKIPMFGPSLQRVEAQNMHPESENGYSSSG